MRLRRLSSWDCERVVDLEERHAVNGDERIPFLHAVRRRLPSAQPALCRVPVNGTH